MDRVSDILNSPSDIYCFNLVIENGDGSFVLPYTSSIPEDVSVSFRKIEFLPYKIGKGSSFIKNCIKLSESRPLGKIEHASNFLDTFNNLLGQSSDGRLVTVLSFYHYDPSRDENDTVFTVDYILLTDFILSRGDNIWLLKMLNRDLNSKRILNSFDLNSVFLLDATTYPDWLLGSDKKVYSGLMCSCYFLKGNETAPSKLNYLIGNIDTNFKMRTDTSVESSIIPALGDGSIDSFGFGESASQTKYRGVNYCVSRCCLSRDQVQFRDEELTISEIDAFSSLGNLMIYFNNSLMSDPSISITGTVIELERDEIISGSTFLIRNSKRFGSLLGEAFANVFFDCVIKIDESINLNYMRITSPQVFRSSVLLSNRWQLEGVMYQGKTSFESKSPYWSNFVQCHREAGSNNIQIKVELFTNSNLAFGGEEFIEANGLLLGELVVFRPRNPLIENIY